MTERTMEEWKELNKTTEEKMFDKGYHGRFELEPLIKRIGNEFDRLEKHSGGWTAFSKVKKVNEYISGSSHQIEEAVMFLWMNLQDRFKKL